MDGSYDVQDFFVLFCLWYTLGEKIQSYGVALRATLPILDPGLWCRPKDGGRLTQRRTARSQHVGHAAVMLTLNLAQQLHSVSL